MSEGAAEVRYPEPVLCYIERGTAWFTTRDIRHQWGDDWNDAPYEHNAGCPYEWHSLDAAKGVAPWEIVRASFSAPECSCPSDIGALWGNSPFTVEMVNAGLVPWLWQSDLCGFKIFAGTTLGEFTRIIRDAGGRVTVIEDKGE